MSDDWFPALGGILVFFLFAVAIALWIGTAFLAWRLAPDDRPWAFFWMTLFFLGPLGIAAALVAQPRDVAQSRRLASGRRRFVCPRCGADNDIPESDRSYDCWRCSEHRTVQAAKKAAKSTKSTSPS
jgi:DNA-directed RNA polymerase subunit RPC12/RpoP